MKIEYKNKNYRNEDIFQVGNVIEHDGDLYLVAYDTTPGEYTKYFLVNLMTIWRKSPYFSRGMDSPK